MVLSVMANTKSSTGFESKCPFCRGLWFRGKVRALPEENHDIFYTTLTPIKGLPPSIRQPLIGIN